jgi:hypothetical protein
LRLLAIEVRRPHVAVVVVASASACLVVVRHRSSVEGEVEEGEGRGDEEVERGRENRATANEGFYRARRRTRFIEAATRNTWRRCVAVELTVTSGTVALFMATSEPAMVINYFDPPLVAGKRAQPIRT